MAKVVTVFRSGGDFKPWHVQALQRQVYQWSQPGTYFMCLSDVKIPGVDTFPLEHDWPGWWAKMELFRPDMTGDFVYTDLDNVVLGPINDILSARGVVLNTGVDNTAWTSLMKTTPESRAIVWKAFMRYPKLYMDWFNPATSDPPFGDAGVVSACLNREARRWEEILPGQVQNISTMATPFGFRVPSPKPRIVLCHRPHRPWTLPIFNSIYGENV
jgi:hypothetical protein